MAQIKELGPDTPGEDDIASAPGTATGPNAMTAPGPRVAIITPVYNGAPWLARTLACVQAQTYANLVHIVLDNNSSDDTPELIRAASGGRVPLITARNSDTLNQTDNWSAAVAMTPPDAEYILLLCADDLIRADAVEKLVARAVQDPDIVLVAAGDVVEDRARLPFAQDGAGIIDGKDMIRAVLTNGHNHYAWQCFFARWRADSAPVPYFSSGVASLDTDRILTLMETGKVGVVYEPLIYTRHHDDTVSAQMTKAHNPKFRLWRWEAQIKYARALFVPDAARAAIRQEQYFLLRYVVSWRIKGAAQSADALCARMAADGFAPTRWDHIAALLSYPLYKWRQLKLSRRANHEFPDAISEADFVAFKADR